MTVGFPPAVRPYEQVRQAAIAELTRWVQRTWKAGAPQDVTAWFDRHAAAFSTAVTQAQLEAAIAAALSIDVHLALQGYPGGHDFILDPAMFGSVAGDGRPVMGLAYAQSLRVAEAQDLYGIGTAEHASAWAAAGERLTVAAATAVSDASRAAKSVAMASRPGVMYVRVLTPPSCSRCVVQAGRESRKPTMDFQRHPGCDCTQAPVYRENRAATSLATDPGSYFKSLTESDQDTVFGKTAARAIRDGADVSQVVNARRGMRNANDRFTTEGTTNRGYAAMYLRREYAAKLIKEPGTRYRRISTPRLTPGAIYRMADGDDDMVLNLLHRHGYLLDASPNLKTWGSRNDEVRAAAKRVSARLAARKQELTRSK